MKKSITITSLVLSALLILDSVNFGSVLVMFIIAGQIPWTSTSLDAGVMLMLFMLTGGVVAGRLTSKLMMSLSQITRLRSVVNR